jgi:hypothetical protein
MRHPCGTYLSLNRQAKKNGAPDQGAPSNSHATTTSLAALPCKGQAAQSLQSFIDDD